MLPQHYLDPNRVRRNVLIAAMEHPLTLYPLVTGILFTGAALALDMWMALSVPALGILACGFGNAVLSCTVRRADVELQMLEDHKTAMERENQAKIDAIRATLQEYQSEAGLNQFEKLNAKFETFKGLLAKKLNPGELTYSRYLNKAMTVYNASLDNLMSAADRLTAIGSIRIDEIRAELANAVRLPEERKQALQARVELYESTLSEVNALFDANESALTLLDLSSTELASTTTSSLESLALKDAMQEFDDHIKRLSRYSIRQ